MRIVTATPAETKRAAVVLARRLADREGGAVLALCGPLGAGKTVFVKGLARGLGHPEKSVRSPSFVIAMEHRRPGRPPLFHLDCYRFTREEEIDTVPFSDYLVEGGVIVVEWAERVSSRLPADTVRVLFRRLDRRRREIVISGI